MSDPFCEIVAPQFYCLSVWCDLTGPHETSRDFTAGMLFSLPLPKNASGNFVKVIQRLPVRIRFNPTQDSQHTPRPGMSVEPTVTVR